MGPRSAKKSRPAAYFNKILASAVILVSAIACAETRDVPAVRGDVSVVPGRALVFGRILAVEKGEPLNWKADAETDSVDGDFHVLILPKDGNAAQSYRLRGDGSFTWSLAPGDYTFAGFSWSRFNRRRSDRIWMDFTVPPNADAVYIGTLKIEASQIPASYELTDQFVTARFAIQRKLARPDAKITRNLMTRKSLSARVRSRREICGGAWGEVCKEGYRGVVSLAPNIGKESTPTVASLRPTLKWRPVPERGVRYDVVVYEALEYLDGRKLQGRVIDYVEGLEKPEYRLARTLKAKTTYYWTVRLRKGDTVSDWTRFGYTGFFGFRYIRRFANLYSFDTPG